MSDKNQRYFRLLDAIEAERQNEEKLYLELSKSKSKAEKQEAGILLSKLDVKKILSSLGNKPEVLFILPDNNIRHRFRVGSGCVLYLDDEMKKHVRGTVSYTRKDQIGVCFTDDDGIYDHVVIGLHYTIELLYDERPYTVMRNAIQHTLKSKEDHIVTLRDGIVEQSTFPEQRQQPITLAPDHIYNLNESQQAAIKTALKSGSISIIHGPPGTGKTTTLVSLIQTLTAQGKKVLACAPSNSATDLISIKLAEKDINVIRVGNLSRIDQKISDITLDVKVRGHKEWANIKKIKIEAEEVRKKANAYKRSYGNEQRNQRRALRSESKQLRAWARNLEQKIYDDILDNARVITSTLIGISTSVTKELKFDTVVIDEASQALEPECWNAIALAKHVILVGDHMQLPPTVKCSKAIELELPKTLLDILIERIEHTALLTQQYRMNNAILGWSNNQFYNGKLISHKSVAEHKIHKDDSPIEYIDTSGCGFEEVLEDKSLSKYNPSEYIILREHFLQYMEHYKDKSIAIISPYAAQVRHIYGQLSDDPDLASYDVIVHSIDGFQGQERDIVYLSLVRNNPLCEIGFLKDYRRLNVALTRARKKLVIIADTATLSNDKTYLSLIDYIEENGLYRSAWEFMS